MSKNLVIVESPAKAKTIKKYLGKDFEVLASFGHVRDLVPKEGAVDPARNFAMNYEVIEKNAKHIDAISHAIRQAEALYLATDPDREGEAISWHICEILKSRQLLNNKSVHRIVFHEITQHAIQEAVKHPRDLSMSLINAQQARRALDYLVGFNLSPVLWKKIRYGLSAGRVQSPALRLIVERELEIEKFEITEYWTIEADCLKAKYAFVAKLTQFEGKKFTQFSLSAVKEAERAELKGKAVQIKERLLELANGQLQVLKVEKKQRKRLPSPPFTTSTLQQEAARKLGFTTKRTMQIAQQLYEGIDIGQGTVGLITYMRTDSVHLAEEAIQEIRQVISNRYGVDDVPKQPQQYKTKSKNAQEAHEAIRPTSAQRYYEDLKSYLSEEQYKLYELIWKRTVACQMIHATLAMVAVDLACGEGNCFRATGSTVVNPGFMKVYQEGIDDKQAGEEDERLLPAMQEGEWINLKGIRPEQHFTEPPPRFSEATLVKRLEELGIGRPSTYAAIISTLQQREYVLLDKKRFTPTDVGRVVNALLTKHFDRYVDYNFTARLEDDLDAISRGEQQWLLLLEKFWSEFKALVDKKMQTVRREDITQQLMDEKCPECGKQLTVRLGKRGNFIGCSGYPTCSYTRDSKDKEDNATPIPAEIVEGRNCPLCHSALHIKQGRYGKFIGCSGYPKCKFIEPLEKALDSGVICPNCQKGTLVRKKSRFGTFFYACSAYPDCKYAISNEPVAEPCPKCHWPILMLKVTKRRGTEKVCPQKECDYAVQVELPPEKAETLVK